MIIERATDAERVNEIVNDPSIYPWIKGAHTGPLDLTNAIKSNLVIALVAEHGCIIFARIQPGVYEFHTCVLPTGRGEWMREAAVGAFRWMFTKTDCYELVTKCPDNNILAKLGAKSVGCKLLFHTGAIWPAGNKKVETDIYGLMLQHWVIEAPKLEEVGHWFHEQLIAEYKRLNREIIVEADDKIHDRYVGAAIEMIRGKQPSKAVNFYNRWAVLSGYRAISMISIEPLIIDIFEAKVRVADNSFEVI